MKAVADSVIIVADRLLSPAGRMLQGRCQDGTVRSKQYAKQVLWSNCLPFSAHRAPWRFVVRRSYRVRRQIPQLSVPAQAPVEETRLSSSSHSSSSRLTCRPHPGTARSTLCIPCIASGQSHVFPLYTHSGPRCLHYALQGEGQACSSGPPASRPGSVSCGLFHLPSEER